MVWIGGVLTLLIMLAVLAMSPNQLQAVLQGITAQQLYKATWILLFVAGGLWLIRLLICRYHYHHNQHQRNANIAPNQSNVLNTLQTQTSQNSLPSNAFDSTSSNTTSAFFVSKSFIYRSLNIITAVVLLLLLLLAAVCHTLAARQALLMQSIDGVAYVEAQVRPVGLSDKQMLEVGLDGNKKEVSSYRLLATLENIAPFDQVAMQLQLEASAKNDASGFKVSNPLRHSASTTVLAPSIASSELASDTSVRVADASKRSLPAKLTVMIQTDDAQYQWLNQLQPTQQVSMRLALYPVKPKSAEDGFDAYRWLSTRHATATAKIISADRADISPYRPPEFFARLHQQINQQRFGIRAHLQQRFADSATQTQDDLGGDGPVAETQSANYQAMAVTLSLLTGDRSLISKPTKDLYQFAGISHLLAISGTHVLFLAIWLATLTIIIINWLCPRLYQHASRWQIRYVVAVIAAFIYAWFTGFDVPAARTAWMLLLLGGLRYLLMSSSLFKPLLILAVLMAWSDPFILWQAGFWLSFTAVVMLVAYAQYLSSQQVTTTQVNNSSDNNDNHTDVSSLVILEAGSNTPNAGSVAPIYHSEKQVSWYEMWRLVKSFFWLQCWMFVALLPLTLWLFGKVSVWGVLVNLFAIGIYGGILVPLNLLAGISYFIAPSVADGLWQMVIFLLTHIHALLAWLQGIGSQSAWLYTPVTLPFLAVIYLIFLPWLLPKGLLNRWLSMPAICLSGLMFASQTGKINSITSVHSQNNEQVLFIQPLTITGSRTVATLISQGNGRDKQAWLLLSSYPLTMSLTDKKDNLSRSYFKSESPQPLAQTLDMQLQKQGVDKLTGIIVQTPSPQLTQVVKHLRKSMAINYYWLAGNRQQVLEQAEKQASSTDRNHTANPHKDPSTHITPRACTPAQQWQSEKNTKKPLWQLQAITGWDNINDARVWSCSIVLHSTLPVVLDANSTNKFGNNDHNGVNSNSSFMVLGSPMPSNKHTQTNLIFNASQDEKLWQLWSLMCPASQTQTVLGQHWIMPASAYFSEEMKDEMQPVGLYISDSKRLKLSKSLQEVRLTWQDQTQ